VDSDPEPDQPQNLTNYYSHSNAYPVTKFPENLYTAFRADC